MSGTPPPEGQDDHVQQLARRIKELEGEVERLTSENTRLKEKASREQAVSSLRPISGDYTAEYAAFVRDHAALATWLKETRSFYTASATSGLKNTDLPQIKKQFEEYQKIQRSKRIQDFQELGLRAGELRARRCPEPCELDDIDRMWSELGVAEQAYTEAINEEERRRLSSEKKKLELIMRGNQLAIWLRQQKANLEVLTNVNLIQEFCAAQQNRLNELSNEILSFTESADSLLSDKEIMIKLVEVSDAWLQLQLASHEKLRDALLEVHRNSRLEDEVLAYSSFSRRVKSFLEKVDKLLLLPTDDDSKAVITPVLEECEDLLRDFGSHQVLTDHLSDFSLRLECLRDNFAGLKNAVLSKLTCISSSVGVNKANSRQEEFSRNVQLIEDWIRTASKRSGVPSAAFGGWETILKNANMLKESIQSELESR
jgi:hypothetical protein